MGIVVYYKSAPQFPNTCKLDLLPTSRSHNKLFMPYPWPSSQPATPYTDYPTDLFNNGSRPRSKVGKMYSGVTNLIARIDAVKNDRWAIVPRLGSGVIWIAPILGKYTIWSKGSSWLPSLRTQLPGVPCVDEYGCLADAAQGWDTAPWIEVPFSCLPRWFSKQLLSQTSFGTVHPLGHYPSPLPSPELVASAAYNRTALFLVPIVPSPSSPNVSTVMSRLVERLSPTMFEILCVELLQAQQKTLSWMHVAGAGDGGADGIGFDPATGSPRAILQAKWEIQGNYVPPSSVTHLAYLIGQPTTKRHSAAVCGPSDIARDVCNYWSALSPLIRRALT